tara:strand:- start:108 stop:293 length:186 start_codon:yes stop_codon:yes gene_type:complete
MPKKLTATQVTKLTQAITRSARRLTMDKIDFGAGSNVTVSVPKLLDVTKTVQRMLVRRSQK